VRRLIALLACVVVSTTSLVGVAQAADGGTGSGGSSGGTIWAGVQTSTPPSSLNGGGSVCRWAAETAYDSSTGTGSRTPITMRLNGLRYRLFNRTCNGRRRLVWIPQLSPRQLATQSSLLVYGKLPRPGFRFAPSADEMVVKVGTWIWTDPHGSRRRPESSGLERRPHRSRCASTPTTRSTRAADAEARLVSGRVFRGRLSPVTR